jgi:hypothetical protein
MATTLNTAKHNYTNDRSQQYIAMSDRYPVFLSMFLDANG